MILHLLILLVSVLVTCSGKNSTVQCDRNTKALSYLDLAVDMIGKAKENYPDCQDAKSNLSLKPIDCEEWLLIGYNKSGSYKIWPRSRVLNAKSIDVYCDMEIDGGGWTVIQRRGNFQRPKDYFYQDWSSYKAGFGHIEKDFWLGNDKIFALTNQKLSSVRFDLKDVEGAKKYALYDIFWIDDEIQKYTLHIQDYSGDAGDSMSGHTNMKFSTKDADNDIQTEQHCSQIYKGGWWYSACHTANLNGLYLRGKHDSFADGVNWKSWKDYHESLDTTEIKIRSKNFKQKPAVTPEFTETPRS
ncbi:techylectin-like protein [Parasteatoda tepidariorum]|uniref:techylectin-like protein n=1 Tax=Parasteatoda tepidariorum TaxID=114398 RepID=UPI001C727E78|nr:techylectin-like protein [Parasteatoda tepidariorum]